MGLKDMWEGVKAWFKPNKSSPSGQEKDSKKSVSLLQRGRDLYNAINNFFKPIERLINRMNLRARAYTAQVNKLNAQVNDVNEQMQVMLEAHRSAQDIQPEKSTVQLPKPTYPSVKPVDAKVAPAPPRIVREPPVSTTKGVQVVAPLVPTQQPQVKQEAVQVNPRKVTTVNNPQKRTRAMSDSNLEMSTRLQITAKPLVHSKDVKKLLNNAPNTELQFNNLERQAHAISDKFDRAMDMLVEKAGGNNEMSSGAAEIFQKYLDEHAAKQALQIPPASSGPSFKRHKF